MRTICLMIVATVLLSSPYALKAALADDGRTLSPGPTGYFSGRDNRVEVKWLETGRISSAGDYARRLNHGGRSRHYQVHVPQSALEDPHPPLVLVFHGGGGNPNAVRYQTGMNRVAEREGFVVIYPAGTHPLFTDRILFWHDGRISKHKAERDVDDVDFVRALLDDFDRFLSFDLSRVYATGISNGGHMSVRLAHELSDRIAAVASVSAQRRPGQYLPTPPRAVPILQMNGKLDEWSPFNGGEIPSSAFLRKEVLPAETVVRAWREHNGCPDSPAEETRVGKAVMKRYGPCESGSEVEFWIIENGGHTWPGGEATNTEKTGRVGLLRIGPPVGPITRDIIGSEVIWSFFKRHRLPTPTSTSTSRRSPQI